MFAMVANVLGDGVGVRGVKCWLSRGEEGMFGVARVAVVLSLLIAVVEPRQVYFWYITEALMLINLVMLILLTLLKLFVCIDFINMTKDYAKSSRYRLVAQ